MERRLAAILAADVVGYTRLMGADESGTLQRLKAQREDVLEPLIAAHRGRIVKLMGDGLLVEFGSIVDAVVCAVAWQEAVAEKEADRAEATRLRFRIGINLGDVIVDGDDIYGDGVNVAARLEGLAEPAGICLSGDAFRQVRGKTEAQFEDLGEREVKNVAEPLRVYRIAGDGPTAASVPPTAETLALPDKPSIAILPFTNMSGDPEQEYFADGVSEDIITALSRIRWFFVIARNSSFAYKGQATDVKQVAQELGIRYVLEGSVRKGGNRVRITAQLADGTTGNQVWARRYDRELADIFDLQDEITETIVGAIEPELGKAERERAKSKRPDNLDAWDLYQRGMSHLYRYTKVDLAEAQGLFRSAVELDPNQGPAYSGLAEAYYYEVVYGFADSVADNRERAIEPARRAVALDAEDAGARCTLEHIRIDVDRIRHA
jgi:TolB-like protein